MKAKKWLLLPSLFVAIVLSACSGNQTNTEVASSQTITSTPDLCAPQNIAESVNKVHNHMREFDDGSSLAANLPADQLPDSITNLQRIRREAENEPIPDCLVNLKTYQVSHMNSVIATLINLIGYANGTVDRQVIDQGITLARQQHDEYTLELARLLGITPVPATLPASIAPTP